MYLRKKNRLCAKWLVCFERGKCPHSKPHKRFATMCNSGWGCIGGDMNIELLKRGVISYPRKPECIDLNAKEVVDREG